MALKSSIFHKILAMEPFNSFDDAGIVSLMAKIRKRYASDKLIGFPCMPDWASIR
jgi:hypothetical protein